MQILYALLGLTGLTMLFFGTKWFLKSKSIIKFSISDRTKEFNLNKPGLYAVCILDAGYYNHLHGLNVTVSKNNAEENIHLKESFLKYQFVKHWKKGIEYVQFRINNTGVYKIELGKSEDWSEKKSEQVFKHGQDIEILIKETVSTAKKLFRIIFLVLGVNISFWGIVLTINPNPFGW